MKKFTPSSFGNQRFKAGKLGKGFEARTAYTVGFSGSLDPAVEDAGVEPLQAIWTNGSIDEDFESGWHFFQLDQRYYNGTKNAYYDPKSKMLDYRDEPGGFSELSDEEHEAIMREIQGIQSVDVFINDANGMVLNPHKMVYTFLDSPEIQVPVLPDEFFHTMNEIEQDGADVGEWAVKAKEERHRIPRKGLTPGALVGFEFQMLDSDVQVFEKPEEVEEEEEDLGFSFGGGTEMEDYQAKVLQVTHQLSFTNFGHDKLWFVVADGDNLEFVTNPFHSLEDLRVAILEIEAAANALLQIGARQKVLMGDTVVEINVPGSSAQPQVNPDIPLDMIAELIADLEEDEAMQEDLMGADTKYWRKERTQQELSLISRATERIVNLDFDLMATTFLLDRQAPDFHDHDGNIKGLLQLIAHAAIHLQHFPTQMEKDQPILSKTHLGNTWGQVVGKGVDVSGVFDLLSPILEALGVDRKITGQLIRKIASGIDPVWSSATEPSPIAGSSRQQIFIELRRSPVLTIDAWLGYAIGSYRYFARKAKQQ